MGERIRALLVTSFGLGFMRPAPGTWGSIPPALIAWIMLLRGDSPTLIWTIVLAVGAAAGLACATLGGWAEKRFGRKDPSQIVSDETCGQSLSLVFWPVSWCASCRVDNWSDWLHNGNFWRATLSVGGAFIAFRLADIIKPPPARQLEKLPGGIGVLLDDVAAGLYVAVAVQVVLRLMA